MKRKIIFTLLSIAAFFMVVLSGCSDQKTPMKGYIDETELTEIINGFDSSIIPTKYSYEGFLNYFDYSEELVPRSIRKIDVDFIDSKDIYSDQCSSYYLRLPLHITLENWNSSELNNSGLSLSTRYQLESKIYRPASLDKVYYYRSEDGGFIIKTFGANKPLIIKRPSDITCRGKWNIEIEYDKNGYLIRETFATINSSEKNKSECCYGEAKYTYA